MRIRKTFSYESSEDGPDLVKQIEKLQNMKNSPYWHRSFAGIAGMLLSEYVDKEIAKYEPGESKKGGGTHR